MSKEIKPQPNNTEEVDLGQLFKLIGQAFDKLFKFIGLILRSIYSVFIYAAKAIIVNYKIILITMIIAGAIGYGLEKTKPAMYSSKMIVKTYFETKFQLITNINYYNSLINSNKHKELSNIFEIDSLLASDIKGFNIALGPESENDKFIAYEQYLSQIDSLRALNITYENFTENRSIYSGSKFEIEVLATKDDIFKSLEKGLNSTFLNPYSIKKMEKRDSVLEIEKVRLLTSLKQVDSLKREYLDLKKEEMSSNNSSTLSLKDGTTLVQERLETKEYELLIKELELRQALAKIESEKVEEDVFFDVLSSFQETGSLHKSIWGKYSLIFPILFFILLVFTFLTAKFIKYVLSYTN
ncbi:MAG: hypothetical protein KJN82_06000 [Bacteroidia bacterium]|nr:hypothetical protein [Bacteroidia bacterium]